MADQTSLRLLEPSMPMEPIHEITLWAPMVASDPGHRWLRARAAALGAELESSAELVGTTGTG